MLFTLSSHIHFHILTLISFLDQSGMPRISISYPSSETSMFLTIKVFPLTVILFVFQIWVQLFILLINVFYTVSGSIL